MISVLYQSFLQGPNLYTDGSVLLVSLRGSALTVLSETIPEEARGLAGCEALAGGEALLELFQGVRRGLGSGAGWELVLALAERVQTEYMLVPMRGRLLDEVDGVYRLLVPADNPRVGFQALNLAVSLALISRDEPSSVAHKRALAQRQRFVAAAMGNSPDMLTLAVGRCALANDIPVYPVRNVRSPTIQLGQGQYARFMMETVLEPQSRHADAVTRDKWSTRTRMAELGLPVLAARLVANADEAFEAAKRIGGPVAVKPVNGAKGIGISLRLTEEPQIRRAHEIAAKRDPRVMIEAYGEGCDHRVLIANGRMVAAAKRVPATVTGDGERTVRQLIAALNADPRRGSLPYEKLMERVPVDARLETLLAQQGMTLDFVPARGADVNVSLAANISQGGTAIDVTDRVHPDNRAAIEAAARACHALVAGVDFLTPDIGQSWRCGSGWILEVNTSPGLRPHWIADPARDVVTPILRVAFAEGAPARVPSVGITGGVGKAAICQMLAQVARAAGRHPAVSTAQGTWSGELLLKTTDQAFGGAAAGLLADSAVDISIAGLSASGLLNAGMTLDGIDVVAVLALPDSEVGTNGIQSQEHLARINSIPVGAARKWVFLDADDPLVLSMRDVAKAGVRIGLVSPNPNSATLIAHRAKGGCIVTLSAADVTQVVVMEGDAVLLELPLADIAASADLPREAQVINAMFVSAIALKLGFTEEEIAGGLCNPQ